jgi:magnesium transporter
MTPAAERRERLDAGALRDAWPALTAEERLEAFQMLPREEADDFFLGLAPPGQAQLLLLLPERQRRLWMRILAPDDAADVLQEVEPEPREALLALLDEPTRREVNALLAYAEDRAGGLMSPRFARVRPDMRVDEAIRYLERQAREKVETIYYAYVLDPEQRLVGAISFRDLFAAPAASLVREVMRADPVSVPEQMDQEEVARLLMQHALLALPVVDDGRRMKGIVTFDDVIDVFEEEATEDFHRVGSVGPIKTSLNETGVGFLYRRRIGWLLGLVFMNVFSGASIAAFEDTIAAVVSLVFFLPLLIDSGGNAGSQAATLMVRALATGDVKARDWFRLVRKEALVSTALAITMAVAVGLLGLFRAPEVVLVVSTAMVLVVVVGSLVGMSLPFLLTRLKVDPATASAPLITSIADILGVLIYFSLATWMLGG